MKQSIYPLIIASLFLTGCVSGDKDYIETPTSDQIADLRDDDNDGVINAKRHLSWDP